MDFDRAIAAHDEAVAARGAAIAVGGEPTFTDPRSEAPGWLGAASGDEKERRARALLAPLRAALAPGGAVLRTLGRQYPEEERPRFSYGLWSRRDGAAAWDGPPDPALLPAAPPAATRADAVALRDALAARLRDDPAAAGWGCATLQADGVALPHRIAWTRPDAAIDSDDPRLRRPSVHAEAIPDEGPTDELAAAGGLLIAVGLPAGEDAPGVVRVELPAVEETARFARLLAALAAAAGEVGLGALVIAGYPPPVDETVAWTTVTPDPGVIEINMAPAPCVATYLAWNRAIFEVARARGLAPWRLHYAGQQADSGGGGHITLGGPTPEASPFFVRPHTLGAFVRYLNRHPALSYLFAPDGVGSSGQAPRPDEGVRESFSELGLALDRLARRERPTPEEIWGGLAPFLADRAGNSHRAEVNVEKLWNPHLPGRGRLGVIELRAFGMAPTPERAAALAALVRAIACLLGEGVLPGETARAQSGLVDWGEELHDRFALPFHLLADLDAVLADLDAAGLGLGGPIADELRDASDRVLGEVELDGCRLLIRRAIEFWPLVGDTAGQERGTSRWVDASTRRVEVAIRGPADALEGWRLIVDGVRVPLRRERDRDGMALVGGLRWRCFEPRPGLHPGLAPRDRVAMLWHREGAADARRITLHEWIPGGGAYDGLPADPAEAARRRAARVVVEEVGLPADPPALEPPPRAATRWCLDLRRLEDAPSGAALAERLEARLGELVAEMERRAAPGNLDAYEQVSYRLERDGDCLRLTVIYDPISETAEVRNDVLSARVASGRITEVTVRRDLEQTTLPDRELSPAGVDAILAEARAFCERAVPPA